MRKAGGVSRGGAVQGGLASIVGLLLAVVLVVLPGCASRSSEERLTPVVAPPAIETTGVLAAGVDLSYPPFGGVDKGRNAGIDVDVAAALAERLGLRLSVVDVQASQIATALADRRVDVALAGLPVSQASLSDVTVAGSYVVDGPAFFSTQAQTLTVGTLGTRKVGAQRGSAAYWALEAELGTGEVKAYPTLRAALQAAESGEVDCVAGDAIVGAYIARDFPSIRFAGQLGPAMPIGVVTRKEAPELESAVRKALDALSAGGVLDAIRSKWTTGLPELEVAR